MRIKFICKSIVAIAFLCLPLSSHAENWVEFYFHRAEDTKTGHTLAAIESFYDSDSFRYFDDDTFKVWIKQSSSYTKEFAKFLGKGNESKKLLLINCKRKTFEVLSGGLDTSNSPPEVKDFREKLNRGNIKGNLVYEELADILCANKTKVRPKE